MAAEKPEQNYGAIASPSPLKENQSMKLKPIFLDQSYLMLFLSVPTLAFQWHWISICSALVSAIICWGCGYARHSIVDPMIFKSLFVVFGFALGFRNVRSNFRYGEALNNCKQLFGTAWSVITLFREKEPRVTVEKAMIHLLECIAAHLRAVSVRQDSWYALVGLRPAAPREQGALMGAAYDFHEFRGTDIPEQVEVAVAPRNLMVSVFVMAGNEICKVEMLPLQERKRTFWLLRASFFLAFENCELLALPSVTRAFWTLITNILFLFGVMLPWGISGSGASQGLHNVNDKIDSHKDFLSAESIQSLFFIMFNTLMCMVVLFGLNALAHENEQPFRGGSSETVYVDQLVMKFREAVQGYEAGRDAAKNDAENDLEGLRSKGTPLSDDPEGMAAFLDMAQHLDICCTSCDPVNSGTCGTSSAEADACSERPLDFLEPNDVMA